VKNDGLHVSRATPEILYVITDLKAIRVLPGLKVFEKK